MEENIESRLKQLLPSNLFFEKRIFDDLHEDEKKAIFLLLYSPGLLEERVTYITAILCLLNDAKNKSETDFLEKVFLPWTCLCRRTDSFRSKIISDIKNISSYQENSNDDILHAIGIYRSIISELFDPYITLLFGACKYIENDFSNIFDLDVSDGERQKVEYINKRMKTSVLFEGYDPDVRNAISHTGGNGISINNNVITFKSIKRSSQPIIKTVVWSIDDLYIKTIKLLELITSFRLAEEIFGLDNIEVINSKYSTFEHFLYYSLNNDEINRLITESQKNIRVIRQNDTISFREKHESLTYVLFCECKKRDLLITSCGYNEKDNLLLLELKDDKAEPSNDMDFFPIITSMVRIGIISKSIFGEMFTRIIITHHFPNKNRLIYNTDGVLIQNYIHQKAGLVDLLNDEVFLYNGNKIEITVNFDQLKEFESQQLSDPFPRIERET